MGVPLGQGRTKLKTSWAGSAMMWLLAAIATISLMQDYGMILPTVNA